MDQKLHILGWIAGSGGFFAVLGAAFGALAGGLYARSGRSSGTGLGHGIARAFARVGDKELSPTARGAVVGAVDGFLFLGVLGSLAGAIGAFSGKVRLEMAGPVMRGSLLLVGGAVFFGVLAYSVTRAGVRAVAAACGGGIAGAFAGFSLAGPHGLMAGTILGVVAGNLAALGWRYYSPRFAEPRVSPGRSGPVSRSSTEVTETPDGMDDGIQGPPV